MNSTVAARHWIWALLVLLCLAPGVHGQTTAAQATQAQIVGINPTAADLGETLRIRLTSKLAPGSYLTIGKLPVPIELDPNDPFWITADIPTSLQPGASVPVELVDLEKASSAMLEIRVIRIARVAPESGAPGEVLRLQVRPEKMALQGLQLLVLPDQRSGAEPVNRPIAPITGPSNGQWSAEVPSDAPAGPASLMLLYDGKPTGPALQFIVTPRPIWRRWETILGIGIAYGMAVAVVYLRMRRRVAERRRTSDAVPLGSSESSHAEPFTVPPLEVPPDLVEAIARGQCVLYAGAGLSARAGLPTWRPFVDSLLRWAESEGIVDRALARSLEQRSADRIADSVMTAVIERGASDALREHLRATFATSILPDVHRILDKIGFTATLTTNFDTLIEQSFTTPTGDLRVYLPGDIDELRSSFSQGAFFVLKLYGSLERPESLLVAPAQYVERIRGDRPFAEFVQQLFHRRSLLFLGASVAGIEAYLEPLRVKPSAQRRHYAVVAVDDAGWRADADLLERKYGIHVLPYMASTQHGGVFTFVRTLRDLVRRAGSVSVAEPLSADDEQAAVQLCGLELRNIGPFEHLELEFTRRWTVLLGDNGVGKSSILRAIAAALAGDQSGSAAGRLLRSRQTEGHITLSTRGGETYVASVSLDSLRRPEVRSDGASALGGSWLVLAFPAIRTMASGPGRGPELREWRQPPNAGDVLPILEPVPDPRVLDFKQWLINLDYAKTKAPELARRVDAVLATLSTTFGILLGGLKLGKITVVDKNVLVETSDGELPLDALSQGTVSLLGWVGVLVQRLHEVSDSSDRRALVLIDEIDAHMHPEWQQAIVSRLVEAFPRVQFIVSTHSPFLAVGRRAPEILRLRRDPHTFAVIAEKADHDTVDMTVGDVLTSYLFGLQTAVDHGLQEDVLKHRELLLKGELSPSERDQLKQLQARLDPIGIASTEADPLYGRFLEEISRRRVAALASLPPLSKEAEERQRRLTREIVQKVLESGPSAREETRQ